MAGRPRMGHTYHNDLLPEFAEDTVALSSDGRLLVCVMCMRVGDDDSPGVPLQGDSWEHCPLE